MLFHVRQIEIENFRALNAIDFSKIQMLHFHSCYCESVTEFTNFNEYCLHE